MVQSIINLDDDEDRILNVVKAKFGLKNKSQAIAMITRIYGESFLEPELRPEYIERLSRIHKEKGIPFRDIGDLRRQIEG